MHLLVLTDGLGGGKALLPSLEYLDHTYGDAPLDPRSVEGMHDVDVVVVDATTDLAGAATVCQAAADVQAGRPVLVVMAAGGLAALKIGWRFGDWILREASPAELETRLRLVCDRVAADRPYRTAEAGDLVIDEGSYQVRLRGTPLDLTFKEFELLKALASAPNRVLTRDTLLRDVWGYEYLGGSRTIDVHIRRLRAKLGPEYESMIVTVRGVGYKLVPPGRRGGDQR